MSNSTIEKWAKIDGYPDYEISTYGRVMSRKNGEIKCLNPHVTQYGYEIVGLCKDNEVHPNFVHRLVARAFAPNPKCLPIVDHINRDRLNNNLVNLRWVGFSENSSNKAHIETLQNAKLSRQLAREIFILHYVENVSPKDLALTFSVTAIAIASVLSGETWSESTKNLLHLKDANIKHVIPSLPNEEVWKEVEGYNGMYQISSFGRVKSFSGKRNNGDPFILTPVKSKKGYLGAVLQKPGHRKAPGIHRLVATAFIPNPHNFPIVHHIDGDPSNNRYDNLMWCDNRYNIIQSVQHRTWKKGGDHPHSKLTEEKVLEIRALYDDNEMNFTSLSKKYGVCTDTIRKVIRRIYWRHI